MVLSYLKLKQYSFKILKQSMFTFTTKIPPFLLLTTKALLLITVSTTNTCTLITPHWIILPISEKRVNFKV